MLQQKILICGSRDFTRLNKVTYFVNKLISITDSVIVGDARGVDTRAIIHGRKLGITVNVFKADWNTHGRRAGIIRNLEMLDERPNYIAAFWNGKSSGTKFMIDTALKRRINIVVTFDW